MAGSDFAASGSRREEHLEEPSIGSDCETEGAPAIAVERTNPEAQARFRRLVDRLASADPDEIVLGVQAYLVSDPHFTADRGVDLLAAVADRLHRARRECDVSRLIDTFARWRPREFAERTSFFVCLRAINALLEGRADLDRTLGALLPRFDPVDRHQLELIDRLLFHDRVPLVVWFLAEGLARYRQPPPERGKILVEQIELEVPGRSLRDLGHELVVDEMVARGSVVTGRESILRVALGSFEDRIARDSLAVSVAHRRGQGVGHLGRPDFEWKVPFAELSVRVRAVALRFAAELHREWDWPVGRACLAREALLEHLGERASSSLGVEAHPYGRRVLGRLPARRFAPRDSTSALIPDVNALFTRWTERLASPGAPFRLAALVDALPLWLASLWRDGLIDEATHGEVASRLAEATRRNAAALAEAAWDPLVSRQVALVTGANGCGAWPSN